MTNPTATTASTDRLNRDLRVLARFIEVFCHDKHAATSRRSVELRGWDSSVIDCSDMRLCSSCSRLLHHALVKRCHCPMNPKPVCKHCPKHCYAPAYRQQIREVMAYSGRKLVMRGRLDYLWHLLF
jgi:hypothetical protein